ncbi:MAG TPA: antitoxin Xre/MbcA/ParS toxin-binding domain-containing protein [Chitinophagaceae bacterium]|nr:antitoxin Xre/MbcA/ParS toxin-binding domain-containing protein [Chitinophagaceae bacterium]
METEPFGVSLIAKRHLFMSTKKIAKRKPALIRIHKKRRGGIVRRNEAGVFAQAVIENPKTGSHPIKFNTHFGFFIHSVRQARNYNDLNKIIAKGLEYKAVRPLLNFLALTSNDIAGLTGVSQRTISRWDDKTILGSLPSKNLVELDTLIQKGINVFGGENEFKHWLNQSNIALGDQKPIDLLSTPYGVVLVEDAVEALEFGNVM